MICEVDFGTCNLVVECNVHAGDNLYLIAFLCPSGNIALLKSVLYEKLNSNDTIVTSTIP